MLAYAPPPQFRVGCVLNFRFEFLKHSCDPPFVKVEIIKEILICMTYLQVWLKHLVSTTIHKFQVGFRQFSESLESLR